MPVRLHYFEVKVTVICEYEKSAGILVEPADRVELFCKLSREIVHDSSVNSVRTGCNTALRLVEHIIKHYNSMVSPTLR